LVLKLWHSGCLNLEHAVVSYEVPRENCGNPKWERFLPSRYKQIQGFFWQPLGTSLWRGLLWFVNIRSIMSNIEAKNWLWNRDDTLSIVLKFGALVLGILISARTSNAATIQAASVSQADVAAAISAAADGDTVAVPAGLATWSSAIAVSKPISVIGQGTNSTIVNCTRAFVLSLPSSKAGLPVRISGFRFNGPNPPPDTVNYWIIKAYNNCTKFRIDHCFFQGGCRSIWTGDTPSTTWGFGVVDHNTFLNCQVGVYITGGNSVGGFAFPQQPGTLNVVCVEDNTFLVNSGYASAYTSDQIYHEHGGRSLIRYNTFTITGAGAGWWENMWDAHGNQGPNCPPDPLALCSTIVSEVYGNTFSSTIGMQRVGYLRGGQQMIYSNTITGSAGTLFELTEEEQPGYPYTAMANCGGMQRVTNSFLWNNKVNGSLTGGAVSGNANYIVEGREFWNTAPSAANGHPAGAYANYRPIVYPHPLVTAASGSTTNPAISVSPGSLDYGAVAVGSSRDLTFTVVNVGSGTLAGVATVSAPFSIIGNSSYSLGSNATALITVRFAPSQAGSTNKTVTFTGGGGVTTAVSGRTPLGTAFNSTQGSITPPFAVNADNTISQNVETADPTQGGEALYGFIITNAGNYIVSAQVYAPDASANSLFVNIDAEPTSPDMIWNIPINTGLTSQAVTWLGTGGLTPQVWSLTAGTHQLYIRGREAGVELGRISISLDSPQTKPFAPGNLRVLAAGS
jgi:hypothetical protein